MERRGRRLSRRQVLLGVGVAGLGLVVGCGRLPWQARPSEGDDGSDWRTGR